MVYSVSLDRYQGPLDVLLEMLYAEKLVVNDISLKSIAEQFIEYIEASDIPDDELADFMTIAVRIVLLKSKSLLPYLYTDEEEEEGLTDRLRMYEVYWKASFVLDILIKGNARLFGKEKIHIKDVSIFSPPDSSYVTPSLLNELFKDLVNGMSVQQHLPHTTIKKAVSLSHKISLLKGLLTKIKKLSFRDYISSGNSKTDIIVNFLAALELIKQNEIAIQTSGDDVTLIKITSK